MLSWGRTPLPFPHLDPDSEYSGYSSLYSLSHTKCMRHRTLCLIQNGTQISTPDRVVVFINEVMKWFQRQHGPVINLRARLTQPHARDLCGRRRRPRPSCLVLVPVPVLVMVPARTETRRAAGTKTPPSGAVLWAMSCPVVRGPSRPYQLCSKGGQESTWKFQVQPTPVCVIDVDATSV